MSTQQPITSHQSPPAAETELPLKVHIRWMIRRDMPEVLAIEREVFEFPWTELEFKRCLRHRAVIGMTAEHGERVVGFMVYEFTTTTIVLLNFAVLADERRRGVGRQLVEKLQAKCSPQRRTRLELEVRESNLAAQVFFRKMGFRARAILRGGYVDSDEDAYRMVWKLEGARR